MSAADTVPSRAHLQGEDGNRGALIQGSFKSVICRRLANTYTCAHVRILVNFVSHRSLTAQDHPCDRSRKSPAAPGEG